MLKKYKFDFLLILVLILTLVTWFVIWSLSSNYKEKVVVISYDSEELYRYDLKEDRIIILTNDNIPNVKSESNIEMTIIIKDKYVYVEESNCHDHICINMGKINKIDDVIVCMPNLITITIKAKNG